MDYGGNKAYFRMGEESIKRWRKWNGFWGKELYHETGVAYLSTKPMEEKSFEMQSVHDLQESGYHVDRLDAQSIKHRFPNWKESDFVDGYYHKNGGWAESGEVIRYLGKTARNMDITIEENAEIDRLAVEKGKLRGFIMKDGKVVDSENVIVASGAWTPDIVPQLREYIKPTAQPIITFKKGINASEFSDSLHPVFFSDHDVGMYGFPATADGTVKIANHGTGFTYKYGEPLVETEEMRAMFTAWIKQKIPKLLAAEPSYRICLYCDTLDNNFFIDHVPDIEGAMIACGGSGHAFKFAPVIGDIISDVFEGKPNEYAPLFKWRKGGEVSTSRK